MVRDSRPDVDGATIRRRRYCDVCPHRFTTYEIPMDEATGAFLTRALPKLKASLLEAAVALEKASVMVDEMTQVNRIVAP
jgi:transcriptional regulator NrdR family protein